MGKSILAAIWISGFLCSSLVGSLAFEEEVTGEYLGQTPPGLTPELFAPGVVSTPGNEVGSAFTPDGKEFYFSRFDPAKGYTIMVMKEGASGWSAPAAASFSGEFSEVDASISPDGLSLFFISKRPVMRKGPRAEGYQIWMLERKQDGWQDPQHLGPVINFGKRHLYPSVTEEGTLYFNAGERGFGKGDFFRSSLLNGAYSQPENLGPSINTAYDETDAFIAPDESFLIFTSVGRPEGFGGGDLYISFRRSDGSWTSARNMGEGLNTPSSEFCPMLSADGKYLFFTSRRRGNDDIYWVSSRIILEFRSALKEEGGSLVD